MSNKFSRIVLSIVAGFFFISISVGLLTLHYLGSKERIGYIEILDDNGNNNYGVRISYYDKVFRNSDIYGVYIKENTLPTVFENIKYISDGSPFADIVSEEKLNVGDIFQDVYYTLKVKYIINLTFITIAIISISILIFNKQAVSLFGVYKNIGFTPFIVKYYDKIFLIFIIFLAIVVRFSLIHFKSSDYLHYLKGWYLHFAENGIFGFKTIYTNTNANYPPVYLLIMAIMSYLPIPSEFFILLWIKIPQIIVDFVLAYYAYKIVMEYTKKKHIAILSYAIILFSPLVLFNGAMWGQCDVIYSTFAIISAYYLYKEKYFKSFLLLGVSISFKTMGIFLLPFFIILTVSKKINLKYYLLLPIPHILATLIAILFGSSFKLAFTQISNRVAFMSYATNFPYLLSDNIFFIYSVSLAAIICAIYLSIYLNSKKYLKFDNFILWSLIISFSLPFVLPRMHERFFFIAEILAIIYSFMKPRYFYIAVSIHISVLSVYLKILSGVEIINYKYSALIMLIVFCLLHVTLYIENFKNKSIINGQSFDDIGE